MVSVPIIPKKLPAAAATFPNGSAPANLLRDPGDGRGALLVTPSYGLQALRIHAAQHGFDLRTTGRGRTLAQQIALLQQRYDRGYIAGRSDYNEWHGETWSLKPGMAMAATPGTSNHGWWCADDLAEQNDADPAADPLSPELLEYLVEWAPQFGWGWETPTEKWHVHWISGDVIPPLAKQVLTAAGIDFPGRPPTVEAPPMATLPASVRILDTRPGGGRVAAGSNTRVGVLTPPSWAGAAIVDIGIDQPNGPGFITAWSGVGDRPNTSVQDFEAWATASNLWHVPLSQAPDGGWGFSVYAHVATHLIVDLVGWDSVL